jgi:ribosomal protein S18 acetylase RimI-like enzyme
MDTVIVLPATTAGRLADAAELVFEYMAATQAETGRLVPATFDQLPVVLRDECHDLSRVYCPPGVLLVAYRDRQPVGCVGLSARSSTTAEIKRLYVRPAYRGGIGRILMDHAHRHAVAHQFSCLTLDVLPTRTAVISFYRRLGYVDIEPSGIVAPIPMISMRRTGSG